MLWSVMYSRISYLPGWYAAARCVLQAISLQATQNFEASIGPSEAGSRRLASTTIQYSTHFCLLF